MRLTPRGGRDAIEGVEIRDDGRPVLKTRVRAAPDNGAANAALVKFLAKTLGLPSSKVMLSAGYAARIKTISVQPDPADLPAAIAVLAGICGA